MAASSPLCYFPSHSQSSGISKFDSYAASSLYAQRLPADPSRSQSDRLCGLLRLAGEQSDAVLGKSLHAAIAKADHHDDRTRLFNSLINTYLKLGLLPDALKVLDGLPSPDVASFTPILSYCSRSGLEIDAFGVFARMRRAGIDPNEFSFVAALASCIRQSNFHLGSQLHSSALKTNLGRFIHVSNSLMGMYLQCGHAGSALKVFDEMPQRDVSSWNAAISGMVEEGRYAEAFELFDSMGADGKYGNGFSLSTLLNAVTQSGEGAAIHAYALKIGLNFDLNVGTALLSFYTKFGFCIGDLQRIFSEMAARDVISWTAMLDGFMKFGMVESAVDLFNKMPEKNHISYNALLAGFCKNGHGTQGLEFFRQILEDGVEISDATLTSLATASALDSSTKKSEQIHGFIIKSGCKPGPWIDASLINMCTKCNRLEDARKIFERNSDREKASCIIWTSLIHAYSRSGQHHEALSLFCRMIKSEALRSIDEFALAALLGLCGDLGFLDPGMQLKTIAVKLGALSQIGGGNALISFYAKCGRLEDAVRFFDQMPERDIVSWNALIDAHLLFRQGDEALSVWNRMENLGVIPDSISYVLIISACKYTKSISVQTCERLFQSLLTGSAKAGPEHYSAMVGVLSFWGRFEEAEELIERAPFEPEASIWFPLLETCKSEKAAQSILRLQPPRDPSSYILMSNLYAASGRWNCSERLRAEMISKGMRKNPVRSWVFEKRALQAFFCRDKSHPQSRDVEGALDVLILECMKAGYQPDISFVLHEVEDYQKREFLFGHSAKLAATYGIMMTSSRTVRVVKSVRLCGDCHEFLKLVSYVTRRGILLRDSTGFHAFSEGKCSCGGCW